MEKQIPMLHPVRKYFKWDNQDNLAGIMNMRDLMPASLE